MRYLEVIWTAGPDGNMVHVQEHDITPEEVEEVLEAFLEEQVSRGSGRPIVFGLTRAGREIAVVYEWIDDITVYPVTAFEVE